MNLCNARELYDYPTSHIRMPYPGCLDSELIYIQSLADKIEYEGFLFYSSKDLDDYHYGLLNSADVSEKRIGIASIIYWGTYFNKKKPNHGLAFSRVEKFLKTSQNVETHLNKAKESISKNECGLALKEIIKIKRLGISFGSKVLAFLAPERVGVYDIHISRYFNDPELEMMTTGLFSNHKQKVFNNFCKHLQDEAAAMNKSGSNLWRDRDGKLNEWRAVDVERAMFFLMQNKSML